MSSEQSREREAATTHELDPGSYTVLRLVCVSVDIQMITQLTFCPQQHATPQHLHLTTRRCFIGPIPKGWLNSHRKSWYKRYINSSSYSSRAATFSAGPDVSRQRQVTGLDGPRATAAQSQSFPQPEDVDEEEDEATDQALIEETGTAQEEAVLETPSGRPRPGQAKAKLNLRPNFRQRLGSVSSGKSHDASSYITAPTRPRRSFKQSEASKDTPAPRRSSFVTALDHKETLSVTIPTNDDSKKPAYVPASSAETSPADPSSPMRGEAVASTRSLVAHGQPIAGEEPSPDIPARNSSTRPLLEGGENPLEPSTDGAQAGKLEQVSSGLVRFNVPNKTVSAEHHTKAGLAEKARHSSWKQVRRDSSQLGEIVKKEKMLVRVDTTVNEIENDYDENDSLRIDARTVEAWREFIVVCRESADNKADYSIQMYKSRVIPAVEHPQVKKRATHEIPLSRKNTRVNLYSSLDKTLVIWVPWKMGKRIYILRTRSAANAMEWYTFIRSALGLARSFSLEVHVPDLSVTLQLENPFSELEASKEEAHAEAGDDMALLRVMEAERAVAGLIIQRCMKMLEDSPEWVDVLEAWLKNERMGLAWKRYDRLEWVHGANEQKMYGTLAMQKSHDLELLPKQHYPTHTKVEDLEEPTPVEGFLIRLTSQRGRMQRFGKMYFKRLYFTTHNQFLCYCRPARAAPPPSPDMPLSENTKIPSASQIVDKTPLIFAVNPYPVEDGLVKWLKHGNSANKRKHDRDAYMEAERTVNSMLQAEGYINLSHVVRIQHVHRGNLPADANVAEGPDIDFHRDVNDTRQNDGKTDQIDDKRTFELALKNGLVVRLQAFDELTKTEWMTRLDKLVKYWKLRIAEHMNVFKEIRNANLKSLEIDEEMESYIGQFGKKWEVTRSVASPQLFNMCGISCCRAITVSHPQIFKGF